MADITSESPVRVGLIGCGDISAMYLRNAARFDTFDIVACADLVRDRAEARASEFNVECALTPEKLLAASDIDLVLNLTIPKAHASIALAAAEAGKSVYNEKPLTIRRGEASKLLDMARANKLYVGCAPDTFLGAGYQTVRHLIDHDAIGEPVAATAFMASHGPDHWHPNPGFYYQEGGGPLFDMGPYYLTALIVLLGPVRRVTASARASFPERVIRSGPNRGARLPVEVPTHVTAVLDFKAGTVATLIMSFDMWHANLPHLEIHGASGSISAPDPNTFGGPVRLRLADDEAWQDVPIERSFADNSRGLGLACMCESMRTNHPGAHRASGDLAFHVLDIMHAIHDASRESKHIEIKSRCERPTPLS